MLYQYETTDDVIEQERLLHALTFSRVPSNLARYKKILIFFT
jgi:hypothetical protein